MNPAAIGSVVFACTFGGALAGIKLRTILPDQHLSPESRDTVKVGIGLIATMTALVLGLVTASAKGSFEAVDRTIENAAVDVLALDRLLARYGPETSGIREALEIGVAQRIEMTWPSGDTQRELDPSATTSPVELLAAQIGAMEPRTDEQRWLQSQARVLSESLLNARWHALVGGSSASVPVPFLVILLFWLTITFTSFGLFAPQNATVISVLFVCALSVAGAVFLVLELDGPFEGVITVSPEPLRFALANLNQ